MAARSPSDAAGDAGDAPAVRSVAAGHRFEIDKVKGSRFIATVEPCASEADVDAFLEATRDEFRDATHNCYAWRLGLGRDHWRYADDGEPSGTAGRPILQEIDGRGLTDIAVVVTRYYGGTKLGTGGLLRAYGASAAAGLDAAQIVERPVVERVGFRFDYGVSGPVRGVLAARGLEPAASDYGTRVHLVLAVPVAEVDALKVDLVEATTGGVRFDDDR
ncbi:MAG: YigZ family protein [Acidobacteriota bacterium]